MIHIYIYRHDIYLYIHDRYIYICIDQTPDLCQSGPAVAASRCKSVRRKSPRTPKRLSRRRSSGAFLAVWVTFGAFGYQEVV